MVLLKKWNINGFSKKIWKTAGFGQDNKNLVKMLERPCEVVPTRLCLLASAPHEYNISSKSPTVTVIKLCAST